MKKLLAIFACLILVLGAIAICKPRTNEFGRVVAHQYPEPGSPVSNPVAGYEGVPDEDLTDVMVPIPMKDRVFNKTGIQCVWC